MADVEPTKEELESYEEISKKVEHMWEHVSSLKGYKDCSERVRNAIKSPQEEVEIPVWKSLGPEVRKLDTYYNFSLCLSEAFGSILKILCSGNISANIENKKATTKLLAEIICFAYEFDSAKSRIPYIQNDFSYYKRALPKMNSSPRKKELYIISDAAANQMSMFYALFLPMTNALITEARNLKDEVPISSITDLLSMISCICFNFVSESSKKEMIDYYLKVLINTIVLYDHIEPAGAFAKGSKLNIHALLRLVLNHSQDSNTDTLLNTIRHTTLHFNSETTPKSVKVLLK